MWPCGRKELCEGSRVVCGACWRCGHHTCAALWRPGVRHVSFLCHELMTRGNSINSAVGGKPVSGSQWLRCTQRNSEHCCFLWECAPCERPWRICTGETSLIVRHSQHAGVSRLLASTAESPIAVCRTQVERAIGDEHRWRCDHMATQRERERRQQNNANGDCN